MSRNFANADTKIETGICDALQVQKYGERKADYSVTRWTKRTRDIQSPGEGNEPRRYLAGAERHERAADAANAAGRRGRDRISSVGEQPLNGRSGSSLPSHLHASAAYTSVVG